MFVQYDDDGWTVCEDVLKLYDKGMEIGALAGVHRVPAKKSLSF